MRRFIAALALLLIMQTTAAQADMQLFVAEGTISAAQAQEMAQQLGKALDQPVETVMQAEDGRSFSQRMMDGCAPELAILCAGEVDPWAREGLLAALDSCGEAPGGQLYALPLFVRERMMAVRTDCMEEARMAYLLDARTYPAWVPMQVLQALDELALLGVAGLEIWPPKEGNTLFFEAFLQGVSGEWFLPGAKSAQEIDGQALKNALMWLSDMARAGLIGAAQTREEALERFIGGETAIFSDWSQAESQAYAQEIKDGEIVLLSYPSVSGMPVRAAQLICICAVRCADGTVDKDVRRAALLAAQAYDGQTDGARTIDADNGGWLSALETLEGGATLRSLLREAVAGILSGEEEAEAAAQRILRALDAAAR